MVRTKLKRERVDSPSSSKRLKTNSPTPSSVVIADPGYRVQYPPTTTKQPHKLTQSDLDLIAQAERHRSPFLEDNDEDGSLNQDYVVTPYDSWRAMRQYNSFVIQEEKYYKHDYVFVKNDENAQPRNVNEKDFWVARILEIRGADASHVYALVNWMYWPDELPQTKAPHETAPSAGRRSYHGNRELLASNFMEVVDVLSCAGKAEVVHWKELDDEDQINTLYWRQTLCRQTGQLSAVRKHCICEGPYCADSTMHGCPNEACKLWLHPECLIDDVLTKVHARYVGNSEAENGKKKGPKPKKPKKNYAGKFKAVINFPNIEITDIRKGGDQGIWTETLTCPKCQTELD